MYKKKMETIYDCLILIGGCAIYFIWGYWLGSEKEK